MDDFLTAVSLFEDEIMFSCTTALNLNKVCGREDRPQ